MLLRSRQTLEELHNVTLPQASRLGADQSLGLAHFSALRSLTMCSWTPHWIALPSRLPAGLQSLTLVCAPPPPSPAAWLHAGCVQHDLHVTTLRTLSSQRALASSTTIIPLHPRRNCCPAGFCLLKYHTNRAASAGIGQNLPQRHRVNARAGPFTRPRGASPHLPRLRELTLRGAGVADGAMSGLLCARAATVLPAGLQMLRWQDPDKLRICAMGRSSIPSRSCNAHRFCFPDFQ